jgi:A/G-specific adenine glycosylase
LPDDYASLRALPGVGGYTARAVLCFGFGRQVAVVDTNAARVLTRALAGRPLPPADTQRLADSVLAVGRAWEHNQAIFDLGATVCLRRRPRCGACPMAVVCAWAGAGRPEPDPASAGAAGLRRQPAFEGSGRQRRGRLVAALRGGPLSQAAAATAIGLASDPEVFEKVVADLVSEGLVRRQGRRLALP